MLKMHPPDIRSADFGGPVTKGAVQEYFHQSSHRGQEDAGNVTEREHAMMRLVCWQLCNIRAT